jgi:hypothetical protein
MDKTHRIRVLTLEGQEVLNGMGKIDHFYNNQSPALLEVDFVGVQYPSTRTLWLEAVNGDIVVQAQVKVDYTSSIIDHGYTSFKSIPNTIRTFDKRVDHNIPNGPKPRPCPTCGRW